MRFEPKSEKEVAEAGLLSLGDYDFEVAGAKDSQSKAGNDMIEVKLRVYNNEGQGKTIFDYLVHTEGSAYKVRHFAYSIGLGAQYEAGELRAEDLEGRTGRCKVFIKKDPSKAYPDKNAVSDYLPPTNGNGAAHASGGDPRPPAPPFDDEIPF
jgi:hypothetical protein